MYKVFMVIFMWKILGIEPTNDIDEIKSAYAKLVLKYDPEAYPEEFRIICDAYKDACRYAVKNSGMPRFRRISRNSRFAREYAGFDNITVMINEISIEINISKSTAEKGSSQG